MLFFVLFLVLHELGVCELCLQLWSVVACVDTLFWVYGILLTLLCSARRREEQSVFWMGWWKQKVFTGLFSCEHFVLGYPMRWLIPVTMVPRVMKTPAMLVRIMPGWSVWVRTFLITMTPVMTARVKIVMFMVSLSLFFDLVLLFYMSGCVNASWREVFA